jgi:hypothetical protein
MSSSVSRSVSCDKMKLFKSDQLAILLKQKRFLHPRRSFTSLYDAPPLVTYVNVLSFVAQIAGLRPVIQVPVGTSIRTLQRGFFCNHRKC